MISLLLSKMLFIYKYTLLIPESDVPKNYAFEYFLYFYSVPVFRLLINMKHIVIAKCKKKSLPGDPVIKPSFI